MQHVSVDMVLFREGNLLAWGGRLGFKGHSKESSGCVLSRTPAAGQVKTIAEMLGCLKYPVEVVVAVSGEEVASHAVSELIATFGQHRLEIVGRPSQVDVCLMQAAQGAMEVGRGVVMYEKELTVAHKLLDALDVDDPFICFEDDRGGRCFVEHVRPVVAAQELLIQDEIQWDLFR